METAEHRQIADLQPGLHLRAGKWSPKHMERPSGELRRSELIAPPCIDVELHRIAVVDAIVGCDVSRLLVEALQADVQILLIPQEQELTAAVGEVGVADMNRRHEGALPIVQPSVHGDRSGLRNQANEGLLLSERDIYSKQEHRQTG